MARKQLREVDLVSNGRGQFIPYEREVEGWNGSGERERERLCTGPAHDEPTWLPATDKYFYRHRTGKRAGKLFSRCRLCANWEKLKSPGLSGYVPVAHVQALFIEARNRVGITELARRTGIERNILRQIVTGQGKWSDSPPRKYVQKKTVKRLMLELISMRRKGEVRHRDSIISGGYIRGFEEKIVRSRRDLLYPHGDADGEARRIHRLEHLEHERKVDREYRRRVRSSEAGSR